MSLLKLAIQSLRYYLRNNFALALGVAAATAVLTGALIVGDSMRTSLRELALDRLGNIDEILVSDGFFRESLADEIQASDGFSEHYTAAQSVILFPNGSVQIGDESVPDTNSIRRVSKVNVFGISNQFSELSSDAEFQWPQITGSQVIINQSLADELGVSANDLNSQPLILRIPKPTQLPADSSLGKKRDLIESMVDLEIAAIVPNRSIGRFGLHVSQIDSPNIYVPISKLQATLARSALKYKNDPVANAILLTGKNGPPSAQVTAQRLASLKPSLSDFGLSLKEVLQLSVDSDSSVFNYYTLSSDRLVISPSLLKTINQAIPNAKPVFTYLANDIRKLGAQSGIPFSMISAIDIADDFELLDLNERPIEPVQLNEIVVNQWAAENLNIQIGDRLSISYFEPEATHGAGVEQTTNFVVKAIAKLSKPDTPFRLRRRKLRSAQFLTQSPTLANDPELTPEVPGLTDARSIQRWDLPFATADKLRPEDDDYWEYYRTTPKGFISLAKGQQLWNSRFGNVTSLRIPKSAGKISAVEQKILAALHDSDQPHGFSILPIKRQAVLASSGSTPFDLLFLALSTFVIGAALILVSLLFRLTLQQRAAQIGLLQAVGWSQAQVSKALVLEMTGVSLAGVLLGLAGGVGYAAIMIFGLKTWWLGAISSPILDLRVSGVVLAVGGFVGWLISLITIVYTVRKTRGVPIRKLLTGEIQAETQLTARKGGIRSYWLVISLYFAAIGLAVFAIFLGGEPQAGAFMGAGFLVLAATLLIVYRWMLRPENRSRVSINLRILASMSARRNPLRTTLTIGLVAVASFLIMAVSSFRLSPSEEGTGGFDLIATSEQPIFEPLEDQSTFNIRSYSFRVKAGEDASCNNLYQSSQPSVIGVTNAFIEHFSNDSVSFRWASKISTSLTNPWWLLKQKFDDGAIPVIIDKNTANYSLKIFSVGGDYNVDFGGGQITKFRVVGFLENSILQGRLIIAEDRFVQLFPQLSGYRLFLAQELERTEDSFVELLSSELEERYSDVGFDAESAVRRLAKYQQVQNTYISTFQTLGALGLLLGTFGLAMVQIRSVLERQQELALMRSVGFAIPQLNRMILIENISLLFIGLLVGIGSAAFTTLPHYLYGGASIPWFELSVLFVLIGVCGSLAALGATAVLSRVSLIDSLRK